MRTVGRWCCASRSIFRPLGLRSQAVARRQSTSDKAIQAATSMPMKFWVSCRRNRSIGTSTVFRQRPPLRPPGHLRGRSSSPSENLAVLDRNLRMASNVWNARSGHRSAINNDGMTISRAGEGAVAPPGTVMTVKGVGQDVRRALVVVLHDSAQPWQTLKTDWTPKSLCPP